MNKHKYTFDLLENKKEASFHVILEISIFDIS